MHSNPRPLFQDEEDELAVQEKTSSDVNESQESLTLDSSSEESSITVECFRKPLLRNQKRKCMTEDESWPDDAYKIMKGSVKRDEFSTYGEHVANEIRKLPPTAQNVAKHLINNILFDASMGKYHGPTFEVQHVDPSAYYYLDCGSPSTSSTSSIQGS